MTVAAPRRIKLCPECNADNDDGAARCWACKGDLAKAQEVVFAELVAQSGKTARRVGEWVGIAAVALVGIVLTGATLTQSLGLGIGLALVFVVGLVVLVIARPGVRTSLSDPPLPPVAATSGSYFSDSPAGTAGALPLPRVTPASAVVRQVLVTLGVVALVMFSGFIALCIACVGIIFAISSSPHH